MGLELKTERLAMLEAIVFYILAVVLIAAGLIAITRTNPIASALALVAAFGVLAALYALLKAALVAVIQVLVYAGGIMVLIVFAIMLLNLRAAELKSMKARGIWIVLALIGALAVVLGPVLFAVFPGGLWNEAPVPGGFGSAASLGGKIFSDYLFPFEMLSLLLLAAVVGALVLAKRKL
jgi:NADH-quinone oxidoreductase subunit J